MNVDIDLNMTKRKEDENYIKSLSNASWKLRYWAGRRDNQKCDIKINLNIVKDSNVGDLFKRSHGPEFYQHFFSSENFGHFITRIHGQRNEI